MITKIKDIIRNYEPKKAAIRIGIVLIVGIVSAIAFGINESCLLACANVAGIIYGIRIIREVPRFEFHNSYHTGYWSSSSYSWLADIFGAIIILCLPLMIAFCVGWFLMLVEVVQSVIYCVRRIKSK